jgi:hypothetical protein
VGTELEDKQKSRVSDLSEAGKEVVENGQDRCYTSFRTVESRRIEVLDGRKR